MPTDRVHFMSTISGPISSIRCPIRPERTRLERLRAELLAHHLPSAAGYVGSALHRRLQRGAQCRSRGNRRHGDTGLSGAGGVGVRRSGRISGRHDRWTAEFPADCCDAVCAGSSDGIRAGRCLGPSGPSLSAADEDVALRSTLVASQSGRQGRDSATQAMMTRCHGPNRRLGVHLCGLCEM
jgi:hypothetical protein